MSMKFLFRNTFALHRPGVHSQLPHHPQTFFHRQVTQIVVPSLLAERQLTLDLAVGVGHISILPFFERLRRGSFGLRRNEFSAKLRGRYELNRKRKVCRCSMRWVRFMFLVVLPTLALAGCAMFDVERWNLDRYRDERAVDIDRRLSEDVPIGQNPFGSSQGQDK